MVRGLKTPRAKMLCAPMVFRPCDQTRRWAIGLALGLAGCTSLWAQEFALPGFRSPLIMPVQGPSEPPPEATERRPLLRLGNINLNADASVSGLYNDNLNIQPHDILTDYIVTFMPEFIGVNAHQNPLSLAFDYAPGFFFYFHHPEFNNVGHKGAFTASYALPRVRLSLSESASLSQGAGSMTGFTPASAGYSPSYDAGSQVQTFQNGTAVSAQYDLSAKTTLSLQTGLSISTFERGPGANGTLNGSTQWPASLLVTHQMSERLALGLGAGLQYCTVENSSSQWGEQAFIYGRYALTEKLDVSATLGLEEREYGGEGGTVSSGFRYVVTGTWYFLPRTSISLDVHRTEYPSVGEANQDYIQTGLGAVLTQRVGHRAVLTVGAGYDNVDYVATSTSVMANRQDQFYSLHSNFGYQLSDRLSVGLFYTYRQLDSTSPHYYRNNIAGLSTTWRF